LETRLAIRQKRIQNHTFFFREPHRGAAQRAKRTCRLLNPIRERFPPGRDESPSKRTPPPVPKDFHVLRREFIPAQADTPIAQPIQGEVPPGRDEAPSKRTPSPTPKRTSTRAPTIRLFVVSFVDGFSAPPGRDEALSKQTHLPPRSDLPPARRPFVYSWFHSWTAFPPPRQGQSPVETDTLPHPEATPTRAPSSVPV